MKKKYLILGLCVLGFIACQKKLEKEEVEKGEASSISLTPLSGLNQNLAPPIPQTLPALPAKMPSSLPQGTEAPGNASQKPSSAPATW